MRILDQKITKADLLKAEQIYDGPMVKGVVDIQNNLLAIDAPMHADLEQFLLQSGSKQDHLWGINLYPEDENEDFIEFDSMINIRPRQNNRTRSVEDPLVQQQIIEVVSQWIQ